MKTPLYRPSIRTGCARQAGFSLVELMVAITLGLIVLLAVGSIYIGSRQTYRVQEENARLQEAGKYALEALGHSFRKAGSDGELTFNEATQPAGFVCGDPASGCVPVDNNAPAPAADTIRNQFFTAREELLGGVWGARNCIGGHIAVPAPPAAPAVVTNIFDRAPDAASTATGNGLRCRDGAGGAEILVSNLEDFQVMYGIDTNGDFAADRYVDTPANWDQVMTARVCILIQSASNGLVPAGQRYLNCAGALGTALPGAEFSVAGAGDLRLHRSFVATYNLRNRINVMP